MTFTEFLDLRTVETHPDGVTIECPLKDFFFNPDGSLHGGVIAAIADEAVWYAMEHVVGQRESTTVELKVNFLRAASNTSVVRARAVLVKTGRTLCVGTVELRDVRGTLCSIATATYFVKGPAAG
jgi:acyl-CoA thioesterase